MQEHSRYEEMCAAAAAGQISAEELSELQVHIGLCNCCKDLQRQFIEISSLCLTHGQKLEPEIYNPESALRKKVLQKLQTAGAEFSAPVRKEIAERPARLRSSWIGAFRSPTPVWAVALVVLGTTLGLGIGALRHRFSASDNLNGAAGTVPSLTMTPERRATSPTAESIDMRSSERADASLQPRLIASEEDKNRLQLQKEVTVLSKESAALRESANQLFSQLEQVKATADQDHAAALTAESQLRILRDAQVSKDAELVAAQYRLRDLELKLSDLAAAAERDRQLMAISSGSELRNMIAARSLHIIDVADVDNGGVRKPFGRVFYTEGRSLIFYAYDLSNTKGKQTFYAWGHREGDPHASRPLGALENDDETQKRWVFRFNDAKILAKIDSIYVTLEPSDHPGDKPRGKKLLNAYLGTPANHP